MDYSQGPVWSAVVVIARQYVAEDMLFQGRTMPWEHFVTHVHSDIREYAKRQLERETSWILRQRTIDGRFYIVRRLGMFVEKPFVGQSYIAHRLAMHTEGPTSVSEREDWRVYDLMLTVLADPREAEVGEIVWNIGAIPNEAQTKVPVEVKVWDTPGSSRRVAFERVDLPGLAEFGLPERLWRRVA